MTHRQRKMAIDLLILIKIRIRKSAHQSRATINQKMAKTKAKIITRDPVHLRLIEALAKRRRRHRNIAVVVVLRNHRVAIVNLTKVIRLHQVAIRAVHHRAVIEIKTSQNRLRPPHQNRLALAPVQKIESLNHQNHRLKKIKTRWPKFNRNHLKKWAKFRKKPPPMDHPMIR